MVEAPGTKSTKSTITFNPDEYKNKSSRIRLDHTITLKSIYLKEASVFVFVDFDKWNIKLKVRSDGRVLVLRATS